MANPDLFRIALKLATGAGKTTVMAMLIAWKTVNAVRHSNSKQFTRGFLIVAPGLTIKDRPRVLLPRQAKRGRGRHRGPEGRREGRGQKEQRSRPPVDQRHRSRQTQARRAHRV